MIEAIFTPYDNLVKVSGLYQYDYGQKLCIKGLELPNISEVHFATDLDAEAEIRIANIEGDSIIVDIPNNLLQDGRTIKCWLFIVEDGIGYTEKTIHLDVIPRAKPQDFIGENEDAQQLLEEFLVKVDADVVEMQEQVATCIEENEGFKDFIEYTTTTFQNNMLEDYEAYKTNLKQVATNSIDFFLDPTQWVDGVYSCDISHMEWSEYARLQVNFEASNTNMENAQVITRYGREGNTFKFYADNETPLKPILVTLLYSGEMVEGTPYVDESLGKKTVTWTQLEDVEDADTLVLMNAEEGYVDSSIYNHTISTTMKDTQIVSDVYMFNKAYQHISLFKLFVEINDFDFSNTWQIDFNARVDTKEFTFYPFLLMTDDTQICGFRMSAESDGFSMGICGSSSYSYAINTSFEGSYTYYYPLHITIQFDGTNFRTIVRGSSKQIFVDKTEAAPSTILEALGSTNKIRLGSSSTNEEYGYIDEFRLRKVLTENPLEITHTRSNDIAYTKYKKELVEYQKEVTLTEASYMKAEGGKLYTFDTTTNTWVEV